MGKHFFSTGKWQQLRKQVLKRKYCERCGCLTTGKYNAHVDHIKPRKLYPELALDMNNLQLLCNQCHNSYKQRKENYLGMTRRKVDIDGLPIDPEHLWNRKDVDLT